jgi:hypothetical protein
MTMPAERLRALHFAEELLRRIASDPQTPDAMRHEAHRLARCFPSQQELLADRTTPGATLSPSHAEAIFNAGVFLVRLKWRDIANVEVRLLLQTVLRHYPTERDGWRSASHLQTVPLSQMLAEWEV